MEVIEHFMPLSIWNKIKEPAVVTLYTGTELDETRFAFQLLTSSSVPSSALVAGRPVIKYQSRDEP